MNEIWRETQAILRPEYLYSTYIIFTAQIAGLKLFSEKLPEKKHWRLMRATP